MPKQQLRSRSFSGDMTAIEGSPAVTQNADLKPPATISLAKMEKFFRSCASQTDDIDLQSEKKTCQVSEDDSASDMEDRTGLTPPAKRLRSDKEVLDDSQRKEQERENLSQRLLRIPRRELPEWITRIKYSEKHDKIKISVKDDGDKDQVAPFLEKYGFSDSDVKIRCSRLTLHGHFKRILPDNIEPGSPLVILRKEDEANYQQEQPVNVNFGTIGAIMNDGAGNHYVLSCMHVLFKTNSTDYFLEEDDRSFDLKDFVFYTHYQNAQGQETRVKLGDHGFGVFGSYQGTATNVLLVKINGEFDDIPFKLHQNISSWFQGSLIDLQGKTVMKRGATSGDTFGTYKHDVEAIYYSPRRAIPMSGFVVVKPIKVPFFETQSTRFAEGRDSGSVYVCEDSNGVMACGLGIHYAKFGGPEKAKYLGTCLKTAINAIVHSFPHIRPSPPGALP